MCVINMSEEVLCTSYLQSEHLTRSQTGEGNKRGNSNLTAKDSYKEEGETETDRYTLGEEKEGDMEKKTFQSLNKVATSQRLL